MDDAYHDYVVTSVSPLLPSKQVPPPKTPKASYEDQVDAQSKMISWFLSGGLALAAVPVLLHALEVLQPASMPSDQVSLCIWSLQCVKSSLSPSTTLSLPFTLSFPQAMVTVGNEIPILVDSILKTQTGALEELRALVPLVSPDLQPEERVKRANDFCKALPPSQLSTETKQFCIKISRAQVNAQ